MTFTPYEIDQWLKRAWEKCERAEFQEVYKAGWRDALTAVMIELDGAKRSTPPQS